LLQPLGEQANPRAVKVEHLRPTSVATDKQKQIAGQYLSPHALGHQSSKGVKRLAHVAGLVEGVYRDAATQPDHASLFSSSATASRSSPRIRTGPHSTMSSRSGAGSAII